MNNIPLDYKQPEIIKKYLPISQTVRPGIERTETLGIVTHHTAVAGLDAANFYDAYINKIKNDNDIIKRHGEYEAYTKYGVSKSSAHLFIAFDGTIYVFIPIKEIAWASGGYRLSEKGQTKYKNNPALYTVDKEVCVKNVGKWDINNRQQEVIADIDADLLLQYRLKYNKDLDRHFDIALDKPECPWYYIKNDGVNWQRHLSMVKLFYNYKVSGKMPRLDLY